jgi:ketosteroid isomerase-like protein
MNLLVERRQRMNHLMNLRSIPLVILFLIGAVCVASSEQGQATDQEDLNTTFRTLIAARLTAFDKGDSHAYAELLATDFVHMDDRGIRREGSEVISRVAKNSASVNHHEIGTVHSQRIGDIAVVDAEVVENIPLGPREIQLKAHELDVFVRRDGHWLYLQHSETPVLTAPVQESIDPAVLDQYLGDYEWWPGYVESITRKGDNLYVNAKGDEPSQLQSSGQESFYLPGDPTLIVFVRDDSGSVTHYLVHFADGQVFQAKKIK